MKDKNRCFYCQKYYENPDNARKCEKGHDVIYVPILREDLNRLLNFIATGDRQLLNERLSRTLFRYAHRE